MIDLKKLSSLSIKDLQNIDLEKLIKTVSENQNAVIRAVVIGGSLLLAGTMFNAHRLSNEEINSKVSQVRQKLQAIEARDAVARDLQNFKGALPKRLTEFEFIKLVSEYGKSHNITITSLSPAESKDMGLYDLTSLDFEAVGSFKDTMLFLRSMEKSPFPLKIDSWSAKQGDSGQIGFEIQVSTVSIHS